MTLSTYDTQHNTLYAIMLSVVMLNIVKMNVVILNVVAPLCTLPHQLIN
jgi:hypothetical protein